MSDETPSVEEIKERLKVEIPVEEEAAKAEKPSRDVVEEMKGLGKQFADTLQTAWNSEERQKVEGEIREGMKSFVNEVDKAIRQVKESEVTAKVKDEAEDVKTKVESSDLGRKAREGFVQGLQWLSEELGKLADQFTPKEKEPPASEPEESAE